MSIAIVGALAAELRDIKEECGAVRSERIAGRHLYEGEYQEATIWLMELGVGLVNAAFYLGALVEKIGPEEIVMVGSAGALPGSGLEIGHLAVATSETLAELGLATGPGLGDAAGLAALDLLQTVDLEPGLAAELLAAAEAVAPTKSGAFLTVVGASADTGRAVARTEKFPCLVENMEGYALAVAGRGRPIRVGQVRGVSNQAGNRDKSTWDLARANLTAQEAVLEYLRRRP